MDEDGDGVFGAGDTALSGVEMSLYRVQGGPEGVLVITTTTQADGSFRFDGLEDGTYRVVQARVPGYLAATYERQVDATHDHVYDFAFPNRTIAQRTMVPIVMR